MRLPHKGRTLTITSFAAIGVLVAGSIAWAAIPDSDGIIHGCYAPKDGSLRVIDTDKGATCPKGFLPLDWNQQGVPGKDGTNGVDGQDGADGAPATVLTWAVSPPLSYRYGSTYLPRGTVLKTLSITNVTIPAECTKVARIMIRSEDGGGFQVFYDFETEPVPFGDIIPGTGFVIRASQEPLSADSRLYAEFTCRDAAGNYPYDYSSPWGFTLTASKTDPYTYN